MNMAGLSFSGDEEEGLTIRVRDEEVAVVNDLQLCLMGYFLTDRPIRVTIMKECMAGICWPVKGVVIKEASTDFFCSSFSIKEIWKVW